MKIYAARRQRKQEFNWNYYAGKDLWIKTFLFNSALCTSIDQWVRVNSVYTDASGNTILRCNIVREATDLTTLNDIEEALRSESEMDAYYFRVAMPIDLMTTEELKEMCTYG
jgi:hypothetical protein